MTSQPDSIRVLTVDDHPLIRQGVAGLLAADTRMELAGEASNGQEAIDRFIALAPDVTLMDLSMPGMDGLEAIARIRAHSPQARIIVLTTFSGDVLAQRGLDAGAQAYLLKGQLSSNLLDTIRAVARGERVISPEVAQELALHITFDALTTRESSVLESIAEGQSNKAVARALSITEGTVKTHVKKILSKLHANDRTHAVTLGLKRGIIGFQRERQDHRENAPRPADQLW